MERNNENRLKIIDWLRLRGSLTISELSALLKVSRPTIYLHLDILEKKNLVKRSKDNAKKGAPVSVTLIDKEVDKEEEARLLKYLNLVKNEEDNLILDNETMLRESTNSLFRGYTKSVTKITDKGNQFLEEKGGKK